MLSWLRSRTRRERLLLIICCVAIPIEMAVMAGRHHSSFGDFNVHREFGRRFLAGEPLYPDHEFGDQRFCHNYMPVSGLYYAPLAMVSPWLASLLRTGSAMACLFLTLYWLTIMIRGRARPGAWRGASLGAVACFLCLQYLQRDVDDGGPHLIYLALIVGATYALYRGREGLGAAGFGLAVALKMSPGLFLLYFAWKRRWRLAGLSAAWTVAWIVLPAAWMGPARWWAEQDQWNRVALSVFSDKLDTIRELNEVRVQNQALKPAVKRLLVAYPEGHILKVDHPLDRAILDLPPKLAGRIATLASLGLLAALVWWSRRPDTGPDDPARPVEVSAILIVILLLSPVTWLQHLVFLLPALFLIVAEHRTFRPLGRASLAVLGTYAVIALLLSRDIIGKPTTMLLLSFHIHTLGMLLLLGLLMVKRPTAVPALVEAEGPAAGRGPHGPRNAIRADRASA